MGCKGRGAEGMKRYRCGHFVRVMKCNQMLLGHPVMSQSENFITVCFDFYPRAGDYERFEKAGWGVHGHIGHNDLNLNIHDSAFYEVTFRRLDPAVVPTQPVPIEF